MTGKSSIIERSYRRSAPRRLQRTMVRENARRSPCSLCNLYSAPRIFASAGVSRALSQVSSVGDISPHSAPDQRV